MIERKLISACKENAVFYTYDIPYVKLMVLSLHKGHSYIK